MKNTDFNKLSKEVFESAKKRGFHDVEHTEAHWIMLVACELAEAVEADRCGKRADRKEYERLVAACEERVKPCLFELHIKDTVEDELADAVIRLLDYIGMMGYEVPTGYIDKKEIGGVLDSTYRGAWSDMQTMAERLFVSCIANIGNAIEIPESTLFSIFCIAELYEIDLLWFIREKMKYNDQREFLHGKAY